MLRRYEFLVVNMLHLVRCLRVLFMGSGNREFGIPPNRETWLNNLRRLPILPFCLSRAPNMAGQFRSGHVLISDIVFLVMIYDFTKQIG